MEWTLLKRDTWPKMIQQIESNEVILSILTGYRQEILSLMESGGQKTGHEITGQGFK